MRAVMRDCCSAFWAGITPLWEENWASSLCPIRSVLQTVATALLHYDICNCCCCFSRLSLPPATAPGSVDHHCESMVTWLQLQTFQRQQQWKGRAEVLYVYGRICSGGDVIPRGVQGKVVTSLHPPAENSGDLHALAWYSLRQHGLLPGCIQLYFRRRNVYLGGRSPLGLLPLNPICSLCSNVDSQEPIRKCLQWTAYSVYHCMSHAAFYTWIGHEAVENRQGVVPR